jgi:hypothetical protein
LTEDLDPVARYGMAVGLHVRSRTILVEGTTDADFFQMAAHMEKEATKLDLLGNDLAILAAGEGDDGGARGVIRRLVPLREIAKTYLLPNGRPQYRFVGVLDNDAAGRGAVHQAHGFDHSILEYKDLFRLCPVMPLAGSLDPGDLQRTFERENASYKNLDWEIEDLLAGDFVGAFLTEFPPAVRSSTEINGKVHRDLTTDGKARLHRFVKKHAIHKDLVGVIEVLKALRYYLGLK